MPTPFLSEEDVERFLAIPTPPPSPLTLLSLPLPRIRSPPLPVSLPLPLAPPPLPVNTPPSGTPPSGIPPLLPIPLPTLSPPLHLLSTDRRADRPEVTLPPRKRLGISLDLRYEVGESSSALTAGLTRGFRVDYGFITIMDREIRHDPERDVGAPTTDDTELGQQMTEFVFMLGQFTYEIYTRLDDAQTERQLMAGRLNMLYRDRRAHARIALLMEREARMSREAWGRSMDASDLAHLEKMAPKRATRSTPVTTTTTTSATDSQLKETIDQGVAAALAACDAYRNMNGEDSHNPGTSELALMCVRMFPKESNKIERYVGGLPDMIHGSVASSKPKTMQEAIEMCTELMDKKIRTFAECQTETKWKQDDNQQQQNKWQNTCRAYTAGTGEKRQYGGSKSLCSKCNYHHDDPCAPKCYKCNKVGHLARGYRSMTNANNANN
ncbi:hypothetical protein Tco_1029145 [Tanacetum coccineum]|uniref:CCHC-type domain-containing protein n=1 Tax=Tanacetum coccineum TaxID=301880 RepID=A0ABQ5G467_9ASTR